MAKKRSGGGDGAWGEEEEDEEEECGWCVTEFSAGARRVGEGGEGREFKAEDGRIGRMVWLGRARRGFHRESTGPREGFSDRRRLRW